MATKQTTVINIPRGLDSDIREDIARDIIDFIISRTKRGLDRFNKPFKKYSNNYKDHEDFQNAGKSNLVDLSLTGDMIESIQVARTGDGFIVLEMEDQDSNDKASYNKDKGREFLGITEKDKNRIVSRYVTGSTNNINVSIDPGVARGLLRRIIGG